MRNCLDLALSHNLHLEIQHLTYSIAGDALKQRLRRVLPDLYL